MKGCHCLVFLTRERGPRDEHLPQPKLDIVFRDWLFGFSCWIIHARKFESRMNSFLDRINSDSNKMPSDPNPCQPLTSKFVDSVLEGSYFTQLLAGYGRSPRWLWFGGKANKRFQGRGWIRVVKPFIVPAFI